MQRRRRPACSSISSVSSASRRDSICSASLKWRGIGREFFFKKNNPRFRFQNPERGKGLVVVLVKSYAGPAARCRLLAAGRLTGPGRRMRTPHKVQAGRQAGSYTLISAREKGEGGTRQHHRLLLLTSATATATASGSGTYASCAELLAAASFGVFPIRACPAWGAAGPRTGASSSRARARARAALLRYRFTCTRRINKDMRSFAARALRRIYLPVLCRAASYIVCSLPVSSRCYTTTTAAAAAAAASCCITSAHCLPACLYCSGATAYVWSADKYTAIACSLALLRPVPVPAAASFTSSVGGAARKLYYCSQLSIWSSAPSSYIYSVPLASAACMELPPGRDKASFAGVRCGGGLAC
jgi:hypothetical protein